MTTTTMMMMMMMNTRNYFFARGVVIHPTYELLLMQRKQNACHTPGGTH